MFPITQSWNWRLKFGLSSIFLLHHCWCCLWVRYTACVGPCGCRRYLHLHQQSCTSGMLFCFVSDVSESWMHCLYLMKVNWRRCSSLNCSSEKEAHSCVFSSARASLIDFQNPQGEELNWPKYQIINTVVHITTNETVTQSKTQQQHLCSDIRLIERRGE